MSRITELQIHDYRCFKALTVRGLSRVNLIVGANNSGKTALLEAIEIIASRGSPARIWSNLARRGEFIGGSRAPAGDSSHYDLTQLIAGRPDALRDGAAFSFSATLANGAEPEELSLRAKIDRKVLVPRQREFRVESQSSRTGTGFGGGLTLGSPTGFGDEQVKEAEVAGFPENSAVLFLPAGVAAAKDIRTLWVEIVGNPEEHYVHRLAGMVDPRIKALVVAPLASPRGWEGIYVQMLDQQTRVPIAGFGDGLHRALLLALALVRCRKGVLLIDEIDDGLHYSLLPKLWRFLVEGARQLDVQVFATTHSKDCLEAIDLLHREQPDFARDISIHRLEAGRSDSVDLGAKDVSIALMSDQEVR